MKKTCCDKCGCEIEDNHRIVISASRVYPGGIIGRKDLCGACFEALKQWFKGRCPCQAIKDKE